MLNRFFKNKDDGKSKNLPPGHRPSQVGGDGAGGGENPVGGGFFNLPMPAAKGPTGYPSSTPSPDQLGGGSGNGMTGPGSSGHGYHGRPSAGGGGHHSVPSYGAPQPPPSYGQPQPPMYGGNASASSHAPPPAAATGGMDMFGGMSIKAAPSVGGYGGAPQATKPSPVKYGVPHYDVPPSSMPLATGGSLFSGLDFAPGGVAPAAGADTVPYNHDDEITRPGFGGERKKSSGSLRGGSFNYLDVAANAGGVEAPPMQQRQSVGPGTAGTGFTRPGMAKGGVKKKKTKSFRPGFGRQLSDESAAALQRGELKEDELHQRHPSAVSNDDDAPQRMATNPTDLAHLLPPVRSGSVLAGLTVHESSSASASSSGSVLAGLTVHASGASSPRSSMKGTTTPPSEGGGLLAGLSVHGGKASTSNEVDASTSVVLPSTSAKKKSPPPEPEKPAAPPTPEERLMNTLRDFHASATNFRNSSLKQNDEENRILERKVQLAKQLTQYEIDLGTIEAQQQHACELEDFEKADALNSTINSVRHCITLSESDVRKVDGELAAFVKAKEKAFTNQLRSTRGTLKELEKFREDQENERIALRDELRKYEVERTEHLQFEGERIETELSHVTANMDHLSSEKCEIEGTIEEQCKTEIQLREELLVEKAGVEDEIRELERQLQQKMVQMQDIQSSINKAEKDIDVVRSKYSRQLKRINDREAGLQKTKTEVEADAEQLTQEKNQFTETIHDYEVRIAAFGKRMRAVKKEMRAAVLLAGVLEVQETRREQGVVRKKQQSAELTALADSAAIAEQSFVMLRKQHEDLEKSLTIHHNAIASAESMIPKLDEEKKAAAAQRNFKEAARISKDIKALEKDQATAEEMVEVVEMELQDLKERIDKRETEYEEKKEELKTVEKQLELNTLQELWKEGKQLRQALRKFEKLKSESIAAADGVDFRSSALLLVQAEYDACIVQINALETKYDVTDTTHEDAEEEEESEQEGDEDSEDDVDVERRMNEVAVSSAAAATDASRGATENGGAVDGLGADGPDEIAAKIVELEAMIETATENEEYELAAKLDDKLDMLRLRQQSLLALATREVVDANAANDSNDRQYEQGDDDEEEEGEGVEGGESLEEELRLVCARIKMVEADLERATENEDYDAAAGFDEELQQLRDEESQIVELIAESHGEIDERRVITIRDDEPLPVEENSGLPSMSMFEGLGVKPANTSEQEAAPTMSMFGGLEVKTEDHEDAAVDTDVVVSREPVVSPTETPSSPRRVSVSSGPNSPRRKSSMSMFSGLQVGASSSPESPRQSSLSSMEMSFSGMVTTSSEDQESSSAMFSGLQIGSAVAAPSVAIETAEPVSLFGGLMVAANEESVEEEEATSDDGVFVDSQDAMESTDHHESSVLSGLTINSIEQSTQIHETIETTTTTLTSAAVVETSEAVSVASGGDLFGGLSLTSAAPSSDADADAAQE